MFGKIKEVMDLLGIEEDETVSFQLRFWPSTFFTKIREEGAVFPFKISERNSGGDIIILELEKRDKSLRVGLISLEDVFRRYLENIVPLEVSVPFLVVIGGKRSIREFLGKQLYGIGLHRGWVRQKTLRTLDGVAHNMNLDFELISFVYELRLYRGITFIAAGTANFWPRGVRSIREAVEGYISPFLGSNQAFVYIKSLRFRLIDEKGKTIGTYIVDRWGRVTSLKRSDRDVAIHFTSSLTEECIENYVNMIVGYRVSVLRADAFSLYSIEDARSTYFEAIKPGEDFFNSVRSIIQEPRVMNNRFIMIPIHVGNPRLVARIFDRSTGSSANIVATYDGLRISPAAGSTNVPTELIGKVVEIFQNLIAE